MSPSYGQRETSRLCALLGDAMGAQLRQARERRGLSVRMAAAASGLSEDTWRGLEDGLGSRVGLPTWVAAARAVGADFDACIRLRGTA